MPFGGEPRTRRLPKALRFTPDEAAAYLNEAMGLDLAARDAPALEGRTEALATGRSIAYSAGYAPSVSAVRGEAEAVAAQPIGSGPGALTARTTADIGPPGTEASKGRDTIG
jgi:hypothetical protein